MKVAIVCDQLVERTPAHSLLEMVSSLFPEAVVYTLAHKKGKVLGPLEMHSIRSSFLSYEVSSVDDLHRKSFLIPKALKKLSIPCSFDAVIIISSGLAHSIPRCKKSRVLEFVVENSYKEKSKSLLFKFFRANILRISTKSMTNDAIFSSCPQGNKNNELMPFVDINDWRRPSSREKKCVLMCPEGFTKKEILFVKMAVEKIHLDFVLEYIPDGLNPPDCEHLEHPCSGELLPVFHRSLCFIQGTKDRFPFRAIESMLSGVPVISAFSELNSRVLLSAGVRFIQDIREVSDALSDVNSLEISPEMDEVLRRRHSEKVFKGKFLRFLRQRGIDFSIG